MYIGYRMANKKILRKLTTTDRGFQFYTIYLKGGSFNAAIIISATEYIDFVTAGGHYGFLKVTFGLSNSPAMF